MVRNPKVVVGSCVHHLESPDLGSVLQLEAGCGQSLCSVLLALYVKVENSAVLSS